MLHNLGGFTSLCQRSKTKPLQSENHPNPGKTKTAINFKTSCCWKRSLEDDIRPELEMKGNVGWRGLGSEFQGGTAFHFKLVRFLGWKWKWISWFIQSMHYKRNPSPAHKCSAINFNISGTVINKNNIITSRLQQIPKHTAMLLNRCTKEENTYTAKKHFLTKYVCLFYSTNGQKLLNRDAFSWLANWPKI